MLGMFPHQLAPELERILADRMGELVYETLKIDGVVVDVHAAPEARRHVRVAHGMINQQVRNGVTDRRFRSARVETLESDRICRFSGRTEARIDCPDIRI